MIENVILTIPTGPEEDLDGGESNLDPSQTSGHRPPKKNPNSVLARAIRPRQRRRAEDDVGPDGRAHLSSLTVSLRHRRGRKGEKKKTTTVTRSARSEMVRCKW